MIRYNYLWIVTRDGQVSAHVTLEEALALYA